MSQFSTQNIEAERFLLSLICRDPEIIDELPSLKPLDFTGKYRVIFQAIQKLVRNQQLVDVPHVNGIALHADPSVTEEEVRSIFNEEAPPGSHDRYFKLVRDQRILNTVFRFGGKASESVVSFGPDDDVAQLVDNIEKGALRIREEIETGENFKDAADIAESLAADLDKPQEERTLKKIPTGFPEIDTFIGGLAGGEMVLIIARPSDGKTAMMLQIAINIHLQHKVGIISLEMSAEQLIARVASNISRVSYKLVANGMVTDEEKALFLRTCRNFPRDRIKIEDTPGLTVEAIRGKARRLVRNHDCELLMVDYLQLVKKPKSNDNMNDKLGYISNELKGVARELNVPLVVVAQVNREPAKENRPPVLSDIRGSGEIEQDADEVFSIFRPDGHKNPGYDVHHEKGRNNGEMDEPAQLYYETDSQRIVPVVSGELFLPDVYNQWGQ